MIALLTLDLRYVLLLVFACGVHNGDLLFFCFFSAHNPVRELSMGCAQV